MMLRPSGVQRHVRQTGLVVKHGSGRSKSGRVAELSTDGYEKFNLRQEFSSPGVVREGKVPVCVATHGPRLDFSLRKVPDPQSPIAACRGELRSIRAERESLHTRLFVKSRVVWIARMWSRMVQAGRFFHTGPNIPHARGIRRSSRSPVAFHRD